MNDTDLKNLQRALAGRLAEPHPEEEAWERFALGELPEPERLALIDHALGCGMCARTMRAVGALAALERPAAVDSIGAGRRRKLASPWRRVRPERIVLALAALLLVAIAAPWLVGRLAAPPMESESRGTGEGERVIELLAPLGAVSRGGLIFRWDELPGAESYRVHLFREDGLPVATSSPVTGLELAAERLGVELPAGRWLVRIEALRGGAPVGSSTLRAFEIHP